MGDTIAELVDRYRSGNDEREQQWRSRPRPRTGEDAVRDAPGGF